MFRRCRWRDRDFSSVLWRRWFIFILLFLNYFCIVILILDCLGLFVFLVRCICDVDWWFDVVYFFIWRRLINVRSRSRDFVCVVFYLFYVWCWCLLCLYYCFVVFCLWCCISWDVVCNLRWCYWMSLCRRSGFFRRVFFKISTSSTRARWLGVMMELLFVMISLFFCCVVVFWMCLWCWYWLWWDEFFCFCRNLRFRLFRVFIFRFLIRFRFYVVLCEFWFCWCLMLVVWFCYWCSIYCCFCCCLVWDLKLCIVRAENFR